MTPTCESCARVLGPSEPYWRFALALQGELDDVAAGRAGRPTKEELEALLADLESRDVDELDAEVHEEFAGVLCGACRSRLRTLLRRSSHGTAPH